MISITVSFYLKGYADMAYSGKAVFLKARRILSEIGDNILMS
jgi:hypothetical protein